MQIEKTAKTVNLAIDEALKELNTTIDKINYTILQHPTKGFLGFGSKPAKVLVKLKEEAPSLDIAIDTPKDIQIAPAIKPTEQPKEDANYLSDIPKNVEKAQKPINKQAPDIAKAFLTEIFEKMEISIDIETSIDAKNHLLINLKGEDIGIVIGKRGQTLDSLQYLTNLVVNKGGYAFVSVSLDTEDYRERRKQTLEQLALNLAKKAKKTGKSVSLEPMNPYERRIIHGALQNDKAIKTYSEGNEPFRYVVISPK